MKSTGFFSSVSFSQIFRRGVSIPRLVSLEGFARGHSFYLWEKDQYKLGSGKEADIYLPDDRVESCHALLKKREGRVWLLGKEGAPVFVNGVSVRRHPLSPRDHLRIGRSVLVFDVVTVTEKNFWQIWEEVEKFSRLYRYPDFSQPRIQILTGASEGCIFPLYEDRPTVIGRSNQSDIKLLDSKISRRHCLLELVEADWKIQDLDSLNGTYVSGKPVKEAVLQGGEHIRIGHTVFQFFPSS